MTLQDILALQDIDTKISYLKKGRKTPVPDAVRLLKEWCPDEHEIITDKEKYPDRKVLIKEAENVYDEKTGKSYISSPEYKDEPINRIAIPLEQDIVNIQTAFTVGEDPEMECNPANIEEQGLFDALKSTLKKAKIKYQNKRIVRSWLSEQEVAEYWYAVDDDSFWSKFWATTKRIFKGESKPHKKLNSALWSPFRGDTLYPFVDDFGNVVGLSREYKRTDIEGKEYLCFMTIGNGMVYYWENNNGWKEVKEKTFKHGFKKEPFIYTYRSESYCHKIEPFRIRLEKLLSNYADCIDYNFFPMLKLIGDVEGFMGKDKDRIVKLTGEGADAQYLTWNQVPDTVKFEADNLINNAYDMTNTPRISFSVLKGFSGNAPSGDAFKFLFMGAHMAVANHAEEIGEFMQRRVNFLVSALGDINPYEFAQASKTIDIDVELQPYKIDSIADKVKTAVEAVDGGVWSRREGVIFAGNAERLDEELREINDDISKKTETNPINESTAPV